MTGLQPAPAPGNSAAIFPHHYSSQRLGLNPRHPGESPASTPTETCRHHLATLRKPAAPRYRAIADTLIEGILSGKYPLGTVLPGETEVAERFAISRHTARDAMRLIEEAGLITRRRRVGSTVVSNQLPLRYNQRIQSVGDVLQYGNASRLKLIESSVVTLDEAAAGLLKLKAGAPCMLLKGIRYQRHDNRPFAYSEIHFPVASAAQRERMLDLEVATLLFVRKIDTPHLSSIEQTLMAESATKKLAAILEVRPGTAMLKSMRVYVGIGGRITAAATTWHTGDLFSYSTTLAKSA